jgi:hypothetical protein
MFELIEMKKLFFLLIAAALIGFICFAVMYWLFDASFIDSRQMAITLGATGFIVECLRPLIIKYSNKRSNTFIIILSLIPLISSHSTSSACACLAF